MGTSNIADPVHIIGSKSLLAWQYIMVGMGTFLLLLGMLTAIYIRTEFSQLTSSNVMMEDLFDM